MFWAGWSAVDTAGTGGNHNFVDTMAICPHGRYGARSERFVLLLWFEPRRNLSVRGLTGVGVPPPLVSIPARFMSVVLSAGTMTLYDVDVAVTQRLREVRSKFGCSTVAPMDVHTLSLGAHFFLHFGSCNPNVNLRSA